MQGCAHADAHVHMQDCAHRATQGASHTSVARVAEQELIENHPAVPFPHTSVARMAEQELIENHPTMLFPHTSVARVAEQELIENHPGKAGAP